MSLRILLPTIIITLPLASYGQISEIYSEVSKAVYQTTQGECPPIPPQEYAKFSSCRPGTNKFSPSQWSQIVESTFWSQEAHEEVQRLQCSIRKTQSFSQFPELKDHAIRDMNQKIQVGVGLYQALRKLTFEREQLRQRVNFLRPSGLQKKSSPLYQQEAIRLEKLEESVKHHEALLTGLLESTWNGGTRSINELMMSLIKKGDTNEKSIEASLQAKWDETHKKLLSELNENKDQLESQKSQSRAGHISWNLNDPLKKELLNRALQNNSIPAYFAETPGLAHNLECQLQAKYGKGREHLEKSIFVGTLIGAGGASLLYKGASLLKNTLGISVQSGRITSAGARVLLHSSMGAASLSTLHQIDNECLSKTPSGFTKSNTCEGNPENLFQAEIESLREGNCILSIVMAGAPAPLLVAIQSGLKGIKLNPRSFFDSWTEKGLEKFDKLSKGYGKITSISGTEIRTLDKTTRNALDSQGVEYEVVQKQMVWNPRRRKYDLKLEALERQLENAKAQMAPVRGRKIEADIAAVKAERDQIPLYVKEKDIYTNLKAGLDEGRIQPIKGDGEDLEKNFSLYRVTQLSKKKGPRSYDTPVFQHPDIAEDLERLKLLNVDVRIDPSLDVGNTAALFLSDPKKYNVLFIKANSPYHHFKHEMQHAEFEHFIAPRLDKARDLVSEGKSITSLFSKDEARLFGEAKVQRLESLLKTQNTNLAINETMAVDAQIAQMGFLKVSPSTLIKNEKYALWHQINGFKAIQKNGALNPTQTQEYNKALKKMGMMLSYVDGSQAAQNFLKTIEKPSTASFLAISNKLQNLSTETLQERPIIYDRDKNLIYQRQDGTWERIEFK